MKKLSIIIPTYFYEKRDRNLLRLLESLEPELIDREDIEIIIVDNGGGVVSKEKILEIAEIKSGQLKQKIFDLFNTKIRLITEPETGLSRARNAGIISAKGEYICFLDDDVYVIPGFIDSLINAFVSTHALCAGGSVALIEDYKMPSWLSIYFLRFIIPPKFPEKLSKKQNPYYIIGANMAFKREVFVSYGYFDIDLERVGKKLISGEDTEMILRIPEDKVYIEPRAQVFTNINKNRLSYFFFMKRLYWQGVSDAIMLYKNPKLNLYDIKELSIKDGFLYFLAEKLFKFRLREFLCAIIRFSACKLKLLMLRFKKYAKLTC